MGPIRIATIFVLARIAAALGLAAPHDYLKLDTEHQARPLKAVTSQLTELQQKLARMREKQVQDMQAHRADLEAKLRKENETNAKLRRQNVRTHSAIDKTEAHNSMLRRDADKLMVRIGKLRSIIENIRSNLTVAGEFADGVLNTTAFAVQAAPEVKILYELAKQDAVIAKKVEHEAQLRRVANAHIAMIQADGGDVGRKHDDAPNLQELVSSLTMRLDEAAEARTAAMDKLEAAFNRGVNTLQEERLVLNRTAAELQGSLDAAISLNGELLQAVSSLQNTHDQLQQRVLNFHRFAVRLAEISVFVDEKSADQAGHVQGQAGEQGQAQEKHEVEGRHSRAVKRAWRRLHKAQGQGNMSQGPSEDVTNGTRTEQSEAESSIEKSENATSADHGEAGKSWKAEEGREAEHPRSAALRPSPELANETSIGLTEIDTSTAQIEQSDAAASKSVTKKIGGEYTKPNRPFLRWLR